MYLVSITEDGETTRLRRYETKPRGKVCTHVGLYDTESVTPLSVWGYLDHGAAQDRVVRRAPASALAGSPTIA